MEDKKNYSILDKIKGELEELEVQLSLGNKELKDAFEIRKKRFLEVVKKLQTNLSELEKKGSDKIEKAKKKTSSLIEALENDYNFSYSEFSDQPHNLKKAIEDFEHSLKEYYKEFEGKTRNARSKAELELNAGINKFKEELELHQLHLRHLKEKSKEEWEEWKKHRLSEVENLKHKIETAVDDSKVKAGKFNEEVTEAYRHFISAFKSLK